MTVFLVIGATVFLSQFVLMWSGLSQHFDARCVDVYRDAAGEIPGTRMPRFVRDWTALGGWAVLTLLTTIVCVGLAISGLRRCSNHLLVGMLGGVVVTYSLKWLVARERPEYASELSSYRESFPSGHALLSMFFYCTVATMLARVTESAAQRRFYYIVAIGLALVIGWSRTYLGVHYPTDVVAGWSLGVVWAVVCFALFPHRE